MKVCVYGAGAIGGYMGVQLALAGADVSLIARGPHLAAMQANGVKLRIKNAEGVEEERVANIKATNDPKEVGVVDVVIIALKG
ncbi:MAG: 2-dehydropantoate 2-reductase, partial [Rhodocyclaceae bacterium]|nr:2-dehydropantoate 2-reductase [Rhodocyclaceae bacterium]